MNSSNVYVLDTNIISYYLRGNELVASNVFRALANGHNIIVAPIAYYEIKRGLMAIDANERLKEFDIFCEFFGVGRLDNSILDVAAGIYAELKKMQRRVEDADILIAAFCKCKEFSLVTNNTKHFAHIQGLTLLDWTKNI